MCCRAITSKINLKQNIFNLKLVYVSFISDDSELLHNIIAAITLTIITVAEINLPAKNYNIIKSTITLKDAMLTVCEYINYLFACTRMRNCIY